MGRSMIVGMTDYSNLSLNEIYKDILKWSQFTIDSHNEISDKMNDLKNIDYWKNVDYDFCSTVEQSMVTFQTFSDDIKNIIAILENNTVNAAICDLLSNIGSLSIEAERDYKIHFDKDKKWHDYGNPEFMKSESICITGREYFSSLLDAKIASVRLRHYIGIRMNETNKKNLDDAEEIVMVKPNLFGFGIDFNKLFSWFRKKKKNR